MDKKSLMNQVDRSSWAEIFRIFFAWLWVFICGFLAFYFIPSYFVREKLGIFFFGVIFYILSIPPLCFLEKGVRVSRLRRRMIFSLSLGGLILSFGLVANLFFKNIFLEPFLIFYIFMGTWALCSIWFLIINRKYNCASPGSMIYAYFSVIGVNSGLLLVLYQWQWRH